MTERSANPLEAVSSLLQERQRYEGWIATLESRRASTPPHVYARVHADYDKRLGEVMERLGSRSSELQEVARELGVRIDRVQEEENRRRDERAEAELRATVGEFTPDQWNELRERTDNEIVRLSTEATSLREELTRLEELLRTAKIPRRSAETAAVSPEAAAASRGAPTPAAPPPSAAPATSAAAAPAAETRAPEPATAAPPAEREPAGAAAGKGDDDRLPDARSFDELAFLKSVVEPRDSARAQAAAASPAPANPPADVRQPTPAAAPAVSAADAAAAQARATAPGRRMPEPSDAPPPVAPAPAPVSVDPHRDSIPSFLKDVPNEQVKTLKCQECGTMNYPTEWYCERCGGELAAM